MNGIISDKGNYFLQNWCTKLQIKWLFFNYLKINKIINLFILIKILNVQLNNIFMINNYINKHEM